MEIRNAGPADLDAIMGVYHRAREFMRRSGNLTQWADGYPGRELISQEITAGSCYTMWEDGTLAGVFCFLHGRDVEPTYARIDGAWPDDGPYGVIHRMATGGKRKGVSDACLNWCFEHSGNIRVDTHRDNKVMQHILAKHGFQRCGIIYVKNGTERIAYQKILAL